MKQVNEAVKSFRNFEQALKWAFQNGGDNCLPCHKWSIEQRTDNTYAVAIRYRASGQLVGYAS